MSRRAGEPAPSPAGSRPAAYANAFRTLFSETAAQYAYDILQQRDPLSGAVTSDRATIIWRAWQTARREIANGQHLNAWNILKTSTARARLDPEAATFAEVERLVLISECLTNGHQVLPALQQTAVARDALRRLLERLSRERDACAQELRRMLTTLASLRFDDRAADDGIVAGWVFTRGIDLLTGLAQQAVGLAQQTGNDVDAIVTELEVDAHCLQANFAFNTAADASIRFALGDMLTEAEPMRAFAHFEYVAQLLSIEDDLGLQAATNAAHCLTHAGRYQEAEGRLASLELLYELRGDMQGAARVWLAECVANWKRLHDPAVRSSLVGAIGMYEEVLHRSGGDPYTRYVAKRFIEPGYLLLAAAVARSTDRSDEAADQILSSAWALLSRDLLADLKREENPDPWTSLLDRQRRPLVATRSMLAPIPGLGVVHLLSATDTVVWLAYGFDASGTFRFACDARGPEHADRLATFIQTMHEQLKADQLGDVLAVGLLEASLESLGRQIAEDLSGVWHETIANMQRLIYLPHAFGAVDEFPLAGLRLDGEWLGARLPIVRSPTINHLREQLAPNHAEVRANSRAVVVTGAPAAMGDALTGIRAEGKRVQHFLKVLGFDAQVNEAAGTEEMHGWLDGEIGALHYIGHGIANEVCEGLPLANGETFNPLDIDRLDGLRVPFVFLCACMAARVRAGMGGTQTGIASKLVERGGPAVIAFTMPVIETRVYALAERFYRAAARLPFGAAVQAVMRNIGDAGAVPSYARLAFTAYGDPAFALPGMIGATSVPGLPQEATTWHSRLRNHCVLRTAESAAALRADLERAPASWRSTLLEWIDMAFRSPAATPPKLLACLESAALIAQDASDCERLSVRAAVLAERLHASGIEDLPIVIPTEAQSIRSLLDAGRFLAVMGGAFFDMRLNALGNSIMGRVITVDQNDARHAVLQFRQARQQLHECEDQSPFVAQLLADDRRILQHFGVNE